MTSGSIVQETHTTVMCTPLLLSDGWLAFSRAAISAVQVNPVRHGVGALVSM